MVVRAKPARREDTAVDDEEWVVVKDRSIERGWGVSLFAKENGHSASAVSYTHLTLPTKRIV